MQRAYRTPQNRGSKTRHNSSRAAWRNKISAVILAGGRARRFQGRDKGLHRWRGKTLVAHVLNRLRPQVGTIHIVCGRAPARYRQHFTPRILRDQPANFPGPLTGLLQALRICRTPYVLVCPCDSPVLPAELVAFLYRRLRTHRAPLVFCRDKRGVHYLTTLMRRDCSSELGKFLAAGNKSVRAWQEYMHGVHCVFPRACGRFANINRPQDLLRVPRALTKPTRGAENTPVESSSWDEKPG